MYWDFYLFNVIYYYYYYFCASLGFRLFIFFHFPSDICAYGCRFFVHRLAVVNRSFIPSHSSYLILPLQKSLSPLRGRRSISIMCWRSIALLTELDKGFVSRRRRRDSRSKPLHAMFRSVVFVALCHVPYSLNLVLPSIFSSDASVLSLWIHLDKYGSQLLSSFRSLTPLVSCVVVSTSNKVLFPVKSAVFLWIYLFACFFSWFLFYLKALILLCFIHIFLSFAMSRPSEPSLVSFSGSIVLQ